MADMQDYLDDEFVEIEVDGSPDLDEGIEVYFDEEGTANIGFDPNEEFEADFDDNLAEFLDGGELGRISSKLISLYEEDVESRKDWYETFKDGLDLLGIKSDPRREPFEG